MHEMVTATLAANRLIAGPWLAQLALAVCAAVVKRVNLDFEDDDEPFCTHVCTSTLAFCTQACGF